MIESKLKVKEVKAFVKEKRYQYACGRGKKFLVGLYAGPCVDRYFVVTKDSDVGFRRCGDAVRHFNSL